MGLWNVFKIVETTDHPGLMLQYESDGTEDNPWEVSMHKWEFLLDLCRQGKLVADGGRQTCGLCSLYFWGHVEECEDCPIALAGFSACKGTPEKDYQAAVERSNHQLAEKSAAEEIRFLRKVRDGS